TLRPNTWKQKTSQQNQAKTCQRNAAWPFSTEGTERRPRREFKIVVVFRESRLRKPDIVKVSEFREGAGRRATAMDARHWRRSIMSKPDASDKIPCHANEQGVLIVG